MEIEIVYSAPLKKFVTIWHEAVKLNIAKAQFKLATLYSSLKTDSAALEAIVWYRKAAKQGYTEAQLELGRCYENGAGVKRNYRQAIRWYKNAEHNIVNDLVNNPDPVGDAAAATIKYYFQNEEWAEFIDNVIDYEEDSLEYDTEAAAQGDAEAQNSLGHHYYYGRDVQPNYQQAVFWYRKSAEQGCEAGMIHLAKCYEEEKKYKESAKWYRKYAEKRIRWRKQRLGW